MQKVAVNFHDTTGELTSRFKLHAGDDAGAVSWCGMELALGTVFRVFVAEYFAPVLVILMF